MDAVTPRWRRLYHPWGWLLILLALLAVIPQIDLGISDVFHDPVQRFGAARNAFGDFVRHVVPQLIVGSAGVCVVLWAAGLIRRRTIAGMTSRRVAFLVTTLLIGPGLIVETVLKSYWGRARPDEITQFGGASSYTPPLWISDACSHNCSFVSGHAAVAFWTTAYAFLLPVRFYRQGMAAGLLFGAAVGLVRVMQGAHFVSDVVYAGAIVVAVNALCARFILERAP